MPKLISFRERSSEKEIIDDFSLEGQAITDTFESIEKVNIWLGGNQVLVNSFKRVVHQLSLKTKKFQLHDLGCGSGDGLISLANYKRKQSLLCDFTGVDANPFIIELAQKNAAAYPEIKFQVENIFSPAYQLNQVEIATFNLCLHHFSETEIDQLINKCKVDGVKAIIINDLHRHWLAYYSFYVVCWLFRSPRIARVDGLLSIRKGFKRKELINLAKKSASSYQLRWSWAFRWQLLLFI